jgi:hypothetical protein
LKNNSALILLFSGLLAFFGPVSCGHAAWEQKASYGTRVKYQAGQKIEFPDFTVEYVGERRTSLPAYPRGFLYYDFKVRTANVEKVVSWSSGTGDIAPVDFEIGSKRFFLELRRSDKLGKLNKDELVIRPASAGQAHVDQVRCRLNVLKARKPPSPPNTPPARS